MFDGAFAPTHWIILLLVVAIFFGYKRLPDASKSLARSMRIFKSEMKGFHDDEKPADAGTQQIPSLPVAPPTAAAPQPAAAPPVVTPVAQPVVVAPVADVVPAAPQQHPVDTTTGS